MGIFSCKKPAVKREDKGDKAIFSIGYYKAGNPQRYKKDFFDKVAGSAAYLAVINSEFMYKDQKIDYINGQQELLDRLNSAGAVCKSITVQRKDEVVVFGLTVKRNEDKFYDDLIIGVVVGGSNIEAVGPILDKYNMYYYIGGSEEELLDRFAAGSGSREKLGDGCKYVVFDDSFMKNLVLYCGKEDAGYIGTLLEK